MMPNNTKAKKTQPEKTAREIMVEYIAAIELKLPE
jgi:hypothetical protein